MRLSAVGLAVGLLCSPACAVDFSTVITDLNGLPMNDGSPEKKVFTLGDAAVQALVTPYPDEPNVSATEKFRRAELASRIKNKPDTLMSVGETDLVKQLIGKAYSPIVVFRAWPLLDPSTSPK